MTHGAFGARQQQYQIRMHTPAIKPVKRMGSQIAMESSSSYSKSFLGCLPFFLNSPCAAFPETKGNSSKKMLTYDSNRSKLFAFKERTALNLPQESQESGAYFKAFVISPAPM